MLVYGAAGQNHVQQSGIHMICCELSLQGAELAASLTYKLFS